MPFNSASKLMSKSRDLCVLERYLLVYIHRTHNGAAAAMLRFVANWNAFDAGLRSITAKGVYGNKVIRPLFLEKLLS